MQLKLIIILYIHLILLEPTNTVGFQKVLDDFQHQYFSQYVQHMTGFVATQTFSFDLKSGEIVRFTIDRKVFHKAIRGMIMIQTNVDDELDTRIYQNEHLLQKMSKGKMSIMFANITTNGDIRLMFKNEGHDKSIFLSYELISSQKKKQHVYSTQFTQTIEKYTQILANIKQSQLLNQANLRSLLATTKLILENQNKDYMYAISETFVLVIFWLLSLFMLQKVIRSRYLSVV